MQAIFSIAVAYYAARYYGPQINAWLWGPYTHQSDFGGYMLAFMAAVPVAMLVLWPIVLKFWQDNVIAALHHRRTWRDPTPSMTRDEINQGKTLTYAGRIDRTVPYMKSGWNKKARIQHTFEIRRNTMAMQPRERTALDILETLDRNRAISSDLADQARFALTWGNSDCTLVKFPNLTADRELLISLGVKTPNDLMRLEADYRSANTGATISELFEVLQTAGRKPNAAPEVKALLARLTPPLDEVG